MHSRVAVLVDMRARIAIAQHLLASIADRALAPDVHEGRHDVVGHDGVPVRMGPLQGIEADWSLQVGGIDMHDLKCSP